MATVFRGLINEKENLETFCLIWLDKSVNASKENRDAQTKLRASINHLLTFEDDQQCLHYVEALAADDRVIFIVSGHFGQTITPKIACSRQILAIYVYCFNKEFHQTWANNHKKIKGVFIKLDDVITQIKLDQNDRQHSKLHESLAIKVMDFKQNGEGKSTSDLDGEFLHSLILTDCLVRLPSNCRDEKELISLCKQLYAENPQELTTLKEFQRDYLPSGAVWWYTRQSFIYRLLNTALRKQNIDLLYLFRFFIYDIEEQLKANKCSAPVRVYRAQLMSKSELKLLEESVDKIISMNSFLSTTLNKQRARRFFSGADPTDDFEQVFFEIEANPQIDNIKVFSNVSSLSYYPQEQEVLFMIGSVFRLKKVFRDENGLWIIEMVSCSFNDHQLQELFQHMRKQLGDGPTNLLIFGQILNDMNKTDHAEKYIHRLLDQLRSDHQHISGCYFQLGCVARTRSNYDDSLQWYNKSLQIELAALEVDDPSIAATHNAIAIVYGRKGDYDNALQSYREALRIYTKRHGEKHQTVGLCWNNMGNVYKKQKRYDQALECYERSLDIRKQCLPAAHVHIGSSYNNIGTLRYILKENNEALKYLQQALVIYQKSLPSQHRDIALVLRNLALVCEHNQDSAQALRYYKKAATIRHQLFDSTHPDVVQIESDIERVSKQLD